ncbi:hypothetical protein TNCV_4521061 [Trichonephila clavipes]|nr:hypothetical protein TNCV_4521061 [Trichonephila clavipes]
MIEESIDFTGQIDIEADSDDIQELLDSHDPKLTMDELIETQEQDIEKLESLDPVQSEDRMTVGNFTEDPQFIRTNNIKKFFLVKS